MVYTLKLEIPMFLAIPLFTHSSISYHATWWGFIEGLAYLSKGYNSIGKWIKKRST